MADETPGTTPAPAAVAPPAAAPVAVAAPPAAPQHPPVPYARFAQMNTDYRAAQAELAESNARVKGFEGWLSPDDHTTAVSAAVEKSSRRGDLASKLGLDVDSRGFRFLSNEFDGIERDGWEAKITELRESDPAFFGTGSNGPKPTPRTNPEDKPRADTVDSGRAAGREALAAAIADKTYFTDPKVREKILSDLQVRH